MAPAPQRAFAAGALAALVSGCRTPPAPPAPPPPAPPPVTAPAPVDAAPIGPAGCRASVGWRADGFEIAGLPCVSSDGAEVLLARPDDRPRDPELTVLVVSRADRLTRYATVMEPHEAGELLDAARRPTPALQDRLAKANVLLGEASRRAVPLAPLAPTRAGTHAGGGLEVAWTEQGRLTISREGHFLHEGDYSRWLEQRPGCGPAGLVQAWGDAGRGVLLIKLGHRTVGAGCAAAPALHVIAWTP